MTGLRVGVAHHFGWAIAVTADAGHRVVDRRRIELIGEGLPPAPVHNHGGAHAMHGATAEPDDEALAALVARVSASVFDATSRALDQLAADLPAPILSVSVRDWPDEFPTDIATLRRAPYESRADSVMYCRVLAEVATGQGLEVHRYDHKRVVERAGELRRPPGPPWTADHRVALAAAIMAGR